MAASRPLLSPPTFVSPQNGGHHSSALMNPSSDSDYSTATSSKRLSNYATVRGPSTRRHTAPHPPTPLQLSMKQDNDATTKAIEDDDWTPFQQYSSPKTVPQLESRGSKSQIFSRPAPAYTSTNRPLSSHSTIGASASSSSSSRTPLSPHLFVNDEQVRLRHLKQPQHTHSSPGSTASSPRSSSSLPPPPTNMLTAPTSQRRSSTSFYASSSAQPAYSSSSAVYVRHGCHSASLSTHEGGKEEENKKTKKKSKSIVILRRSPRGGGQQEEERNKKKKGGSTRAWSPTTPNNNTSNHFDKEEQQKEKQKEKAAEDAVEARGGEESWRRTMTEKEREEWVKRQQEGKTKLTREQKKALKDAEKLKKKMEKLKLQQKMNAK
ncbi:hypothetical protein QOT17_009728 [Balamuthia mandrillaris]